MQCSLEREGMGIEIYHFLIFHGAFKTSKLNKKTACTKVDCFEHGDPPLAQAGFLE